MYRGTPYLNRNIKKREEQRSREFHLNNLTHIRPRTGTLEPPTQIHINNRKREMLKQTRFTEIQRENRILLYKLSSIMGKNNKKSESQAKMNKSLNSDFRRRQLQNIEVENAKLLKRLQEKKSNYETQKFRESWRKQKYVIKNLSNYPFILTDPKRKRSSVSHMERRDKGNNLEFCRMRVIDGVHFVVTVRMNQHKMQIIGDTKDKKQIKVIEIERKEALEFIESECQGRIQKIFDCLRYDKVDQVMYLVAKDVDLEDTKNQERDRSKTNKDRRLENPEFDFSVQGDNRLQQAEQIPIHIGDNDNQQYWVQVDKKQEQRRVEQAEQDKKSSELGQEQAQEQEHEIEGENQDEEGYEEFQQGGNSSSAPQQRRLNSRMKSQSHEESSHHHTQQNPPVSPKTSNKEQPEQFPSAVTQKNAPEPLEQPQQGRNPQARPLQTEPQNEKVAQSYRFSEGDPSAEPEAVVESEFLGGNEPGAEQPGRTGSEAPE